MTIEIRRTVPTAAQTIHRAMGLFLGGANREWRKSTGSERSPSADIASDTAAAYLRPPPLLAASLAETPRLGRSPVRTFIPRLSPSPEDGAAPPASQTISSREPVEPF